MPDDDLTELLWRELGAAMRRVRRAANVSIRDAEIRSGYSRGMLSLAENAKAHPGRDLVRWYDETFLADGLLLSLYTEAITAALPSSQRTFGRAADNGDALSVAGTEPGCGVIVAPGSQVTVRWTLRNTGDMRWIDRRFERLGAVGGSHVLASARRVAVPDTRPGDEALVECEVVAPHRSGTYIGSWAMIDGTGSATLPSDRAVFFYAVVVE